MFLYYCSRPLLSRSGCISLLSNINRTWDFVLVPFYRGAVVFTHNPFYPCLSCGVLVPFYRGAVVFGNIIKFIVKNDIVLVPFYRGAVVFETVRCNPSSYDKFSSPFIEERLYLTQNIVLCAVINCSRPLLSRSGCI